MNDRLSSGIMMSFRVTGEEVKIVRMSGYV